MSEMNVIIDYAMKIKDCYELDKIFLYADKIEGISRSILVRRAKSVISKEVKVK